MGDSVRAAGSLVNDDAPPPRSADFYLNVIG